jgi:hypothetical protein
MAIVSFFTGLVRGEVDLDLERKMAKSRVIGKMEYKKFLMDELMEAEAEGKREYTFELVNKAGQGK